MFKNETHYLTEVNTLSMQMGPTDRWSYEYISNPLIFENIYNCNIPIKGLMLQRLLEVINHGLMEDND